MTNFDGYRATGRELRDPVARLVEVESESGLHHTAIVFDPAYRAHDALTVNVDLVASFLEYPMVIGLVELAKRVPAEGSFIYPTGRVWTLAEALRTFRDLYKPVGVRAALEVCVLAAQILEEAGEAGPVQGCFSHGNLNPWRIALKTDGQLQIFGYGLGQVDLLMHRADNARPISAESLRYAPPERLEGHPEDTAADLHALAVIAFEMATGRPLYDGHDIAKLKHMITMSEGTSMLTGGQTDLPPKLAKTLARAMIYDPDMRVGADEFAEEMRAMLTASFVSGPTLDEVMHEVTSVARTARPKAKRLQESKAATGLFDPSQLAALAADEDDDDEDKPTSDGRWGKVSRSGPEAASEPAPHSPRASAPDPDRRRLRRGSDAEATPAPAPSRVRRRTAETETEPDASERRRVRRTEPEPAAPERRLRRTEPDAAPAEPERRLRRTEPDAAPAEPERRLRRTEPDAAPAEPERRLRRTEPDAAPAEPERRLRRTEPDAASAEPERRRRRAEPPPEAAASPTPAPPPERRLRREPPAEDEPAVRRRRRTAEAEPEPVRRRRRSAEAQPASPEPEPPRRRRRRGSSED